MVSGFPVGGGLSSHSVSPLKDGVLVIGRLGGLRTQRKTSAVLKVTGSIGTGFLFKEVEGLKILSRSGHTTTVTSSRQAVVLGGRYEPHRGMDFETLSLPHFRINPSACVGSLKSLTEKVAAETGKDSVASRRYHISVTDTLGNVLIHGGEDYGHATCKDGQPLKDFAILASASDRKGASLAWHTVRVKESEDAKNLYLAAHCAVAYRGSLFIFAGFGKNWKPNQRTYRIDFNETT